MLPYVSGVQVFIGASSSLQMAILTPIVGILIQSMKSVHGVVVHSII